MKVSFRRGLRLALAVSSSLLASCGDGPAFGFGKSGDEAPAPDFSGIDQPADLATPDQTARAGAGLTRAVEAMVLVLGETGDAVGDLFPDEDDPCPGGGSASSDLGGSFSEPELTLHFSQCVRGDNTLDGRAFIHCEDFSGSSCDGGRVSLGEGEEWFRLLHLPPESSEAIEVLILGDADLVLDGGDTVQGVSWQRGEIRSLDEDVRLAFANDALAIGLRRISETQAEIRLNGISALGGARARNCIPGRFDVEDPDGPLLAEDGRIVAGSLRFHSPPPRPGSQQAQVHFSVQGLQASGADGSTRAFSGNERAAFCR